MTKETRILLVAIAVVFILFGLNWWFIGSEGVEVRGTFGDMFGAVNAIFSGLAFIGVIYAILLQRQELSLQRQELTLTRGELKKSADAQERSEQALSKQAKAMEKTAHINCLTASLESLQKRINALPTSGQPKMVDTNRRKIIELQRKVALITQRLDQLADESLDETTL